MDAIISGKFWTTSSYISLPHGGQPTIVSSRFRIFVYFFFTSAQGGNKQVASIFLEKKEPASRSKMYLQKESLVTKYSKVLSKSATYFYLRYGGVTQTFQSFQAVKLSNILKTIKCKFSPVLPRHLGHKPDKWTPWVNVKSGNLCFLFWFLPHGGQPQILFEVVSGFFWTFLLKQFLNFSTEAKISIFFINLKRS